MKTLKEAKDRVKELEKLVAKQQEHIERTRAAKFALPSGCRPRGRGRSFLRVLVPDTHGDHIDQKAAGAFLADLDSLRPAEVIFMGDHLDCGGFLNAHHVMGVVPETEACFEDDIAATNTFLDAVVSRTKGATYQYIEGNHEARIERQIIKATLANARNARFLRSLYGPEEVLGLAKRGFRYISRKQAYDGLKIPGTIDLGNCLARHGKHCGSTAAQRTVAQFGCNIAIAHTHRMLLACKETAKGMAYCWCFGCLCELQPLYYDTDPTDWAHGYGIQVVKPGQGFITIQVPIVDGKSYLSPLASHLEAA